MTARINFVELPARNFGAAKAFYAGVFGWALTDFGPSYSCTMTGDVDMGGRRFHFLDPNGNELAVLKTD